MYYIIQYLHYNAGQEVGVVVSLYVAVHGVVGERDVEVGGVCNVLHTAVGPIPSIDLAAEQACHLDLDDHFTRTTFDCNLRVIARIGLERQLLFLGRRKNLLEI